MSPSFHETERTEKASRLWPDTDLTELVPRSVAYAEVYRKLSRWSAEQVTLASGDVRTRLLNTHRGGVLRAPRHHCPLLPGRTPRPSRCPVPPGRGRSSARRPALRGPTMPEEYTVWGVRYGPDHVEEADDRFDAYRWADAGDGQVVRLTGDGQWVEDNR
jgi:hypothetical protein